MLGKKSIVDVACNSGAEKVKVFANISSCKKLACVGDLVKVSIVKVKPNISIKKGDVFNAIVVRTKYNTASLSDGYMRYGENAVVLLNKDFTIVGTIVKGFINRNILGTFCSDNKFQSKTQKIQLPTLNKIAAISVDGVV